MTQQELQDIEERWKFGTNTREDVRLLLDEVARLQHICTSRVFDENIMDGGGNDL